VYFLPAVQTKAEEAKAILGVRTATGSFEWHKTKYTRAHLECEGFRFVDTPTISCIYHPPTADAAEEWYELTHVYVPSTAGNAGVLTPARDALLAAADARFEPDPAADDHRAGARKLKLKNLSNSKGIRGEITDVAKPQGRANKTQGGRMNMYGAHARRASGPSEKVSGKAHVWPDIYNPSGVPVDAANGTGAGGARFDAMVGAMEAVATHAGALEQIEMALLPEAGDARRAIVDSCDPDAKYRVAAKTETGEPTTSTGLSLSLTHGYVVGVHNDSGNALEAISFAYASDSPLPEGHEWNFVVAGCIHPLPVDRDGFVFVGVRGQGVHHGTLPTSSTEAHFANHAGIGSALVSKSNLVSLLQRRNEPGQLPWPTRDELDAQRRARDGGDVEQDAEPIARDIMHNLQQLESAKRDLEASVRRGAAKISDTPLAQAQLEEALEALQGVREAIEIADRTVRETAMDVVVTARNKAVVRTTAMEPMEPLRPCAEPEGKGGEEDADEEDGDEEGGEGEDVMVVAEEGGAATGAMPYNRNELLLAIAERDFGVLTGAPSMYATPAFKALKALRNAKGMPLPPTWPLHMRGRPLPEGFFIVKVCSSHPQTVRLCQPYSCPAKSAKPTNCKAGPALQLITLSSLPGT